MHIQHIRDRLSWFKDWIINSGIQDLDENSNKRGGFFAWYDSKTDSFPFYYSEMTGYGMSTLAWLASSDDSFYYLTNLNIAVNWIIIHAFDEDYYLVKTKDYVEQSLKDNAYSFEGRRAFAFDNGMVLKGLFHYWQFTNNYEVEVILKKLSHSMLKHFFKDAQKVYPIFDMNEDKGIEGSDDRWSNLFSGHLIKLFITFFLQGSEVFTDFNADERFRQVIKRVLRSQNKHGAFSSYRDGKTHLHAHFNTVEGLLLIGLLTNNEDYVNSAINGFQFVHQFFKRQGIIPTITFEDKIINKFNRIDITAQYIRLGCLLISLNMISDEDFKYVSDSLGLVLNFQKVEGIHKGGFVFGWDLDGDFKEDINSRGSMFAGQAMGWYIDYIDGKPINYELIV